METNARTASQQADTLKGIQEILAAQNRRLDEAAATHAVQAEILRQLVADKHPRPTTPDAPPAAHN
jgi:hypothetical protein